MQNSLKKYGSTVFLIFIVWTLVSSISTVALIGNNSIVFAKKHGSSSSDNGEGSSGGSSSDNTGGGSTTGGSDNSNGGGDTSNTPTPPPSTEDGLTHSNAVKYTITNTNAKELTPPTGITAFREISYDGMKNIIVSNNNNTPTQVPLKGASLVLCKWWYRI